MPPRGSACGTILSTTHVFEYDWCYTAVGNNRKFTVLYSGWSASTIGWRQVGGEAVTVRLRLFRRDQQFGWEFPEDAIEFAYGFDGAQIAPPDNPDSCPAPTRDSRGSRLHGRAREQHPRHGARARSSLPGGGLSRREAGAGCGGAASPVRRARRCGIIGEVRASRRIAAPGGGW